ncbi:MAG: hypothetical protein ACRD1N_09495, partial [Terriglobia bacterium]
LIFDAPGLFAQTNMMPWKFGPDAERALASNTDVLGQEVLAQGEPSVDRVARYFPAMKRPRAIVGVKEHPDAIGVEWDGTLELGVARTGQHGRVRIMFRLGNPPSPYDIGGPVTRCLLDGYLPVVQTRWPFAGLLYEETVFGYSPSLSPDEPLSAYIRLRVTNPRSRALKASVRIYSAPALGGPVPSYSAVVRAGARHDFYVKIPYHVDPQRPVSPLDETEFGRALAKTKTFWKGLLNQYMQITTPESRVNDSYRAWLMYNFLNVHKINGNYEIHDGSGFYEEVYGYSAALYCDALARYGYWKDAEKYLDDMLKQQQPDGLYLTVFGLPDNGALLFALAQEYEYSHDLAWFKSIVPRMIKSCEWISRRRTTTKVMQNGTRPLTYGLLPPGASYCDYQTPVYSYFTDSYNWLGMHETAVALHEAGMTSEAAKWLREADDYRQDILDSMNRAAVVEAGIKALPIEPLTRRLLKQGGGDYYGLGAPEILETKIFAPHDPRADWMTHYMDARGGLLLGLDRFADGVDHAYTYGYALTQLRNGNVPEVLLTFYSMRAYGMSRGTYAAVEVTHLPYGINEMTLPHTYSNTQQLRLLRLMLVRRERDNLLLASGTPRAWLAAGKRLAVMRAPTYYGLLSFTIDASPSSGQIHATIGPIASATGRYPAHVGLWLRAPGANKGLKQVTVNGKPWTSAQDDEIELPGSLLQKRILVTAQ